MTTRHESNGTVVFGAGSFLYMSTDNLRRRTTTGNEFNSTAIVYTAVRSLHFYSDRETTDSVLHLLALIIILDIAWDVALTRIQD